MCTHSITPSTYGYIRVEGRTRGVLGIPSSIELTSRRHGRLSVTVSYSSVYRLFRHLNKRLSLSLSLSLSFCGPIASTENHRRRRRRRLAISKPLSAVTRPVFSYDR